MEEALNRQINAEFYSAYLYLAMAAYFESLNLSGFANWMTIQAQEELTHGMKFYDFVYERGGRVALAAVEAPPKSWDSPLAAFEGAYEHECKISAMINDLVNLALEEKDHATNILFIRIEFFIILIVPKESGKNKPIQAVTLIKHSKH